MRRACSPITGVFHGASGASGSLNIRFAAPGPLCALVPRSRSLATFHPGRSGSFPPKGPGARPGTLARFARPLAVTMTDLRLGRDQRCSGVPTGTLLFFPTIPMKQRIRRLLHWLEQAIFEDDLTFPIYRSTDNSTIVVKNPGELEMVMAPFLSDGPAAKIFPRDRFEAAIFEGTSADGTPCFWLDLKFHDPVTNRWRPILMLNESKLEIIVSVLTQVTDFLESEDNRRKLFDQ